MPRVYDRTPRAQDDKNPLKNLLNFDSIDATALTAGTALASFFTQSIGDALNGIIDLIEELTGLDLSALQPFIEALQEALGALVSGDWSKLINVFTNLFSFLNFDATGALFDPITAAIQFFTNILYPTGLAVGSQDVLGSTIPLVIPFTAGDNASPVRQWFIDIPQAIRDILQNLINAFQKLDPTGVTGMFGDLMLQGFDLFFGIFTKTQTLQRSVNALEAKVFGELGSSAITFSFSGASAALSTLGWTMIDAGAAGMSFTQHDDYVQMTGSAGADATVIAVYDSGDAAKHFTSHIQSCTFLPREQIASSGSTALYMPLRTNNATTLSSLRTCYARIARGGSGGTVNFGVLLDGVATDLSTIPGADPELVSASGLSFAATDRFDFTIGDPDADEVTEADQFNWRWRWYLNTNLILDTVYNPAVWDADSTDLLDDTVYNCPSFGMTADFIFIFLPAMIPPTTLDGLAYYTPAAA